MNDQDKQLIQEFGLADFDAAVREDLLAQYYETVNVRTAMAIEDKLSDEQLTEFEKLHDAGDDAATQAWLEAAVADYDKLIADETTAVKDDIKRMIRSFGS